MMQKCLGASDEMAVTTRSVEIGVQEHEVRSRLSAEYLPTWVARYI